MGVVILIGKGDKLIAGYNTASARERAKVNIKRLRLLVGVLMLLLAPLCLLLLRGTSQAAGWFFTAVTLLVVLVLILANTWAKKKALVFLMVSLGALSSCTATRQVNMANDYYSRYGGQPYSVIVSCMGAPSRVESDGAGGKILVYEYYTHSTSGSSLSNMSNASEFRSNTTATRHYVEFYLSPDDSCYRVRTNHMKDGEKYFSWWKTGLALGLGTPIAYIFFLMLKPK